MAHISGQIHIDAPPELVCDMVADSRNEPLFNPEMRDVELLTSLPIGAGTRFLARMGKGGNEMLVEIVDFNRPQFSSPNGQFDDGYLGDLDVQPLAGRHSHDVALAGSAQGLAACPGAVVRPIGNRVERGIWTGLKRHLEDAAPTSSR